MEQNGNYYGLHINEPLLLQSGYANKELSGWEIKLSAISNDIRFRAEGIKPLIQFLVATIAPAKIYMLNQNVTSYHDSRSIIDLLLIMPGTCSVAFPELEPIINIASSQYQYVSCSLHHEGSVLEWLRKGHVFYSLNCIPDNLVYDNGVLNYPAKSHQDLLDIKEKAIQIFNWYFGKAQEFYGCAESLHKNNCSSLVMFMLHQAAELTFRGILIGLNGYDKRTHEIRVLMKYTRRCAPALNQLFLEEINKGKHIMQLLDKAYIVGRYSSEYTIEENLLSLTFEKVKLLHFTASKIVEQSLN
jgi:HEPN domain-containing protein